MSNSKKSRKARTIFTDKQLQELENTFEKQKYLSVQDRMDLAHRMGLTDTQVKTWYQNRRLVVEFSDIRRILMPVNYNRWSILNIHMYILKLITSIAAKFTEPTLVDYPLTTLTFPNYCSRRRCSMWIFDVMTCHESIISGVIIKISPAFSIGFIGEKEWRLSFEMNSCIHNLENLSKRPLLLFSYRLGWSLALFIITRGSLRGRSPAFLQKVVLILFELIRNIVKWWLIHLVTTQKHHYCNNGHSKIKVWEVKTSGLVEQIIASQTYYITSFFQNKMEATGN